MKITRTFKRNYESKKRIVVNRWWSSSSKTYSILQILFKWLTTWECRKDEWILEWVFTVARQYRAELPRSVLRDFYKICDDEGFILSNRGFWWRVIKENKQEMTFTYWKRILEFIWCDDPEKVKGPRRKWLYVNEANNVHFAVFKQMLMRTSEVCFIDFNPDDDEVWINTEIEQKRMQEIWDVDLIVSTFRDNAYLDESIVQELLNLAKLDPDSWEVFWNGGYGKIQWVIFEKGIHWDEIWEIPEEAEFLWYGQDYWFSDDPTTLVRIFKYWKNSLIWDEVFYETNLVNTYMDDTQRGKSIQWHYEIHWVKKHEKIFADSSEPKSNEELFNEWYNIEWVKKGPWSVISGIKFLKKYKIYVTARSLNLKNELRKYVWATDKAWKVLRDSEWRPIPIDKYNHCIDAWRYGTTHLLWWQDMSDLDFSIW